MLPEAWSPGKARRAVVRSLYPEAPPQHRRAWKLGSCPVRAPSGLTGLQADEQQQEQPGTGKQTTRMAGEFLLLPKGRQQLLTGRSRLHPHRNANTLPASQCPGEVPGREFRERNQAQPFSGQSQAWASCREESMLIKGGEGHPLEGMPSTCWWPSLVRDGLQEIV